MAGKSAKNNNRGLSLLSNFVSGKARDFRTSENAFRLQQKVLATGGNQSPGDGLQPGNGYKYHFFTSPGNFVVSRSPGALIEYVIVGGGGGGGNNGGGNLGAGGGGAGGYLEGSTSSLSVATYPVVIGPGGPGDNEVGVDSTALGLTAYGGGKGTTHGDGTLGGSGGGAAFSDTGGFGLNPSTPSPIITSDFPGESHPYAFTQGYPGGPGAPSPGSAVPGSGGGGAGGAGQESYPAGTPSPGTGSGGGIGRAAFSGDTGIPPSYGTPNPGSPGRWFAGGGAGGAKSDAPAGVSLGGIGGGGNGSRGSAAVAGTTNTGGGGGAGAYDGGGVTGAGGGSGIVIIRYLA